MTDKIEEIGTINSIPVRNIWLLMLYASDLFRQINNIDQVSAEENPDQIPDLIAEILCHHVQYRVKRNLSYGYQSRQDILNRVRGRIAILETERRQLTSRGKIACRFDELIVDTDRNRFVRNALEKISRIVQADSLAQKSRSLAVNLKRMGVTGDYSRVNQGAINSFGRHDLIDKPMVSAAQLAFNLALPTENSGSKHLTSPDKENDWVRKLYEKGIAGFYDVMLSDHGWLVQAGKTIDWIIESKSSGIDKILPSMRTDIILDQPVKNRRIVIDTKFNSVVVPGWHRDRTLRSSYIYQIYSYLRSQEDDTDPLSQNSAGLLLHPSMGEMVNEFVTIQGHEIRFATVDLGGQAHQIRSQLLEVIGET